jgi:hypothetical protein
VVVCVGLLALRAHIHLCACRSPELEVGLDRKLREFPVPLHLIYPGLAGIPEEPNPD